MRAILTYHSIDRSGSAISVSPETFRAHIAWLAHGDVRVVSLSELLALPSSANAVAITFDDALESLATEAAPLLASHGFPATVFVVSQHVGGDNRWNGVTDPRIPVLPVLGWSALTWLQSQGFSIGAHTRQHRNLTRCSSAELESEIAGSADDIAGALGERPKSFAYPYGAFNQTVVAAAARVFDIACTTELRPLPPDAPRELLPRLDAWHFKDASQLARWGTRSFTGWIAFRHALRRLRRMAS